MAAGKRPSPEQIYGRANKQHAHQRLNHLRQQELIFNQQDQDTPYTPKPTHKPAATATALYCKTPYPSIAATMATAEPNEADIGSVTMITACAREEAVRYLRVKKDVGQAINAIMDGEDITKEETSLQWDEGPYNVDRDGNLDPGDRNLRPLGTGTSAAPTRAPTPSGGPTNPSEEDAQLAQALAASQHESGMSFQQESGTISSNGTLTNQSFGPATKAQYDKSEWAMVPLGSKSSEIVPDAETVRRKNEKGEPRFLKALPSGDYLPNFLTIGHSIPLVREALLLRDYTMALYGEDAEWWKGTSIALPKIVHTDDGAPADPEIDKFDEFIAETQRLMAFLDASERSYASVFALTETELLRSSNRNSQVEAFVKGMTEAAGARCGKRDEFMQLFSTKIGTTDEAGLHTPYLEVFELPVTAKGEEKQGLMEILDSLLWDTTSDDVADSDNFIQKGAEVLIMHAKQANMGAEKLQLVIPPTLYLDKYLEANVNVSKPARLEIAEHKKRVAKISEIEKKLTKWQHPEKQDVQIDARAMLQHTLGHFSGKNMTDASNAERENGIVVNGSSAPEQPHYADIASKLESIVISVDKKLTRLAEQKEAIQKDIAKLSNSSPSKLEQEGLMERYTLMGVATKASITYILRPNPDVKDDDSGIDETMSTDADADATPYGMQWWRIDYTVSGSQVKIHKSKVDADTVLRAVELEHTSALLVYASDAAVDTEIVDLALPPALRQFVDIDNHYFETEYNEAKRKQPLPTYDAATGSAANATAAVCDIPRQSIEPGARPPSVNSIDSTLVEGGSRRGSPDAGPSFYEQALPNSGLPPAGFGQSRQDVDEVTEIHLSPPAQEGDGGALHQEMVEMPHEPFLPGLRQQRKADGDASMEDGGEVGRQ